MPRKFKQVDVFTKVAFKGNAVAVFFDADDLNDDQMQQIATWTNLSEATFVLKPTTEKADYQLRIFTPAQELPFAGHPTVGSAFALLESGLVKPNSSGQLIQECKAGLIPIDVGNDYSIKFRLPKPVIVDFAKDSEITSDTADALGITVEDIVEEQASVLVGPNWLVTKLKDSDSILNLEPNYSKVTALSLKYGVDGIQTFGEYPNVGDKIESRTFAPTTGTNEDFACGSGAGSIGVFINKTSKSKFTSAQVKNIEQGRKCQRDARIQVTISGDDVFVGGFAVSVIDGECIL
ncbi:uncharacterized isomerase Yhi9p [[Candida] railenensis]|uniref:Uncharacterized isomerase Yhi9p n=1 Tax=[Candida] railenensis TaxID=45579 RepID=A0A9P0QWS0_9ASCO|nr:uncharacterized isomerase Yhi9p [[Candida] railenensis]